MVFNAKKSYPLNHLQSLENFFYLRAGKKMSFTVLRQDKSFVLTNVGYLCFNMSWSSSSPYNEDFLFLLKQDKGKTYFDFFPFSNKLYLHSDFCAIVSERNGCVKLSYKNILKCLIPRINCQSFRHLKTCFPEVLSCQGTFLSVTMYLTNF